MADVPLTLSQIETELLGIGDLIRTSSRAGDFALTQRWLLRKVTLECMRDEMKLELEENASAPAQNRAIVGASFALTQELTRRIETVKRQIAECKQRLGPQGAYAAIPALEAVKEQYYRVGASATSPGYLVKDPIKPISAKDAEAIGALQNLKVSRSQEEQLLARLESQLEQLEKQAASPSKIGEMATYLVETL